MTKQEELQKQLDKLAYQKSTPFCYACYKSAPTGRCATCGSDDLMREDENGVEYGIAHVVKGFLDNIAVIEVSMLHADMIKDVYGETSQVGFMHLSTVEVMKDQDPVMWSISETEYIQGLEEDDYAVTFDNGGNYYHVSDIEEYIEENLEKEVTA